jgi:hypothetical protein
VADQRAATCSRASDALRSCATHTVSGSGHEGPQAISHSDAEQARGAFTQQGPWQVDYGVEIVDTNGNPERFDFPDFAITD